MQFTLFINQTGETCTISGGKGGDKQWDLKRLLSDTNNIVKAFAGEAPIMIKITGYLGWFFLKDPYAFDAFLQEISSALSSPKLWLLLNKIEVFLPKYIPSTSRFIRLIETSLLDPFWGTDATTELRPRHIDDQRDVITISPMGGNVPGKTVSMKFTNEFDVSLEGSSGTNTVQEGARGFLQGDIMASLLQSHSSSEMIRSIRILAENTYIATTTYHTLTSICQRSSLEQLIIFDRDRDCHHSYYTFFLQSLGAALATTSQKKAINSNRTSTKEPKRKRRRRDDVCAQLGTLLNLKKLTIEGFCLKKKSCCVYQRFLESLHHNSTLEDLTITIKWNFRRDFENDLWRAMLALLQNNDTLKSVTIKFLAAGTTHPDCFAYYDSTKDARMKQLCNILEKHSHTLVQLCFHPFNEPRAPVHPPCVQQYLDLNYYGLSDFAFATGINDCHHAGGISGTKEEEEMFQLALVKAVRKAETYKEDKRKFRMKHGDLIPCLFRVFQNNPILVEHIKSF